MGRKGQSREGSIFRTYAEKTDEVKEGNKGHAPSRPPAALRSPIIPCRRVLDHPGSGEEQAIDRDGSDGKVVARLVGR